MIEAAPRSMTRAVAVLMLFAQFTEAATTFDLSADFSLENNPNRYWQYGYSATNSLDPAGFRFSKYADRKSPIGFWHPSVAERPGPGYYPYIGHNADNQSRLHSSNGWALRAGQIAMEASNTGQYSIVRFVVPLSGSYQVTAQYEGIHFGLSSTDVHVLHNGVSLFQADIDGYGGDPAFHEIQGSRPTALFSSRLELKAKDTISFAVGYGINKTHFGDTTGLSAQVVFLSM